MSYFNRALKTDKNGIPVPQIFNPAVNDFQVLEGSGNQMPVVDAGAHARLDAIEQKIDGIIDGTTPANIQLTGSNVQVAQGIYEQTLSVAASASSVVTVTPPAGEKWRITQLYARITQPSGASSGTHRLRVVPSSTIDSRYSVLYLVSNYNQVLEISNNAIFVAQEKRPANEDAQNLAIRSIVVTNANPLHFMYDNQTDAPQTATLEIRIRREVEKLV